MNRFISATVGAILLCNQANALTLVQTEYFDGYSGYQDMFEREAGAYASLSPDVEKRRVERIDIELYLFHFAQVEYSYSGDGDDDCGFAECDYYASPSGVLRIEVLPIDYSYREGVGFFVEWSPENRAGSDSGSFLVEELFTLLPGSSEFDRLFDEGIYAEFEDTIAYDCELCSASVELYAEASGYITVTYTLVPAPASMAVMALGLLGLGLQLRTKRRRPV